MDPETLQKELDAALAEVTALKEKFEKTAADDTAARAALQVDLDAKAARITELEGDLAKAADEKRQAEVDELKKAASEAVAGTEKAGAGRFSPSRSGAPIVEGEEATGRRFPQKERGIRTREAILELGCRLFRNKGYRNTKVSDITREMRIGKGTFYFYFSDKKELFLECVPRIFESLFSTGWDRIRQVKDPRRRLELRAQAVLPVLEEFCTIQPAASGSASAAASIGNATRTPCGNASYSCAATRSVNVPPFSSGVPSDGSRTTGTGS
jgi:hypothetical protein